MDELEIAGQRYLSTRRAGKEHKYHSDYIGQLIRGGKVKGQKVGRSWYVQEASLSAYLNGSAAESAEVKKEEVIPVVKVQPVEPRASLAKEVESVPVEQIAALEKNIEEKKSEPVVVEVSAEPVVEAAKVPVHISTPVATPFNPTPVRRVPIDDANKIQINTQRSVTKTSTLKYIADESPALPVLPNKNLSIAVSEEVPTYESEYLPDVEEVQRGSARAGALSLAALAVIGVLTFSITAGASVAISSQTIVEEGQIAGAGFTLK